MSLINDALKRAQNLQTRPAGAPATFPRANTPATPTGIAVAESTPTSPVSAAPIATPTSPPALPRQGKSAHSALIVGIASTVVVVGLGAIGYVVYALFFMGTPEEQAISSAPQPQEIVTPVAPQSVAPAPAAVAASTPVTPAPAASAAVTTNAPAASTFATVSTSPATPRIAPATPPNPSTATSASADADADAAASASLIAEEEEGDVRINNPAPLLQAWVDKINVAGIRDGDRPKALMNDRVFVVGDTVNRELGLKLHSINSRLLVFEDADGNTYEYTF